MKSNLPLVSIVVPIYNVEIYLTKCIDSIINQTYQNLEIILVNDGSTDKCFDICEEYKDTDERIKVINKENGGLSEARNYGIDIAKGEWITFVDSDDYVHPEMIESMVSLAKSKNGDIIICGHFKVFEDNLQEIRNDGNITSYDGQEALGKILEDREINSFAWDKIYKRNLFENLRYPKGRIFEDTAFTYKLFEKAHKVVSINKAYYYYVMRETSLSNTKNIKRSYHNFLAFYERFLFAKDNFKELKVLCAEKALHHGMNLINLLAQANYENDLNIKDDLYHKMRIIKNEINTSSLVQDKLKIQLNLYFLNSKMYSSIYKFFHIIRNKL